MNKDIGKICKVADDILWRAYERGTGSQSGGSGIGRLVFARYRDGSLRVSEQEARFAFVEALCSQRTLMYSPEAPTEKSHSLSGPGSRSAQTDIQICDANGQGICNVEFKASGVTAQRKDLNNYCKDVKKLLREPVWGLWFHLLEGINNRTINDFLTVMAKQISKVQQDFKDVESQGLTIHVCVLRHGFSIRKDIPLPIDEAKLRKELWIDLNVSRLELKEVRDCNGWTIKKRGQYSASSVFSLTGRSA